LQIGFLLSRFSKSEIQRPVSHFFAYPENHDMYKSFYGSENWCRAHENMPSGGASKKPNKRHHGAAPPHTCLEHRRCVISLFIQSLSVGRSAGQSTFLFSG